MTQNWSLRSRKQPARNHEAQDFPAGVMGERERRLDHGTMVPLYFIRQRYQGGKIVRIGL